MFKPLVYPVGSGVLILLITGIAYPVNAQKLGHRYIETDMFFIYKTPPSVQVIPGETYCTRYRNTQTCYTTPSTTKYYPASQYERVLRITIDCIDETYDIKGDLKRWSSIRDDADIYRKAMELCRGTKSRDDGTSSFWGNIGEKLVLP